MKHFLAAITLLFATMPAQAGKDCTCRHQQTDVPEGAIICMKTPKGMQMAQCARVLNNTSWKFLGTPCPTASNQTQAPIKKG